MASHFNIELPTCYPRNDNIPLKREKSSHALYTWLLFYLELSLVFQENRFAQSTPTLFPCIQVYVVFDGLHLAFVLPFLG